MRIKQNTSFDFPKCLSTNGFTFFVKLFNHLISLHKPPSCFTLPTFLLVSFVILVIVVKSPKTSSFFWISYSRKSSIFDKNHWFQLLSSKNNWIISLFLISITFHILCLGHSIMSSFCWQKNSRWLSMKTLFLHLTNQVS